MGDDRRLDGHSAGPHNAGDGQPAGRPGGTGGQAVVAGLGVRRLGFLTPIIVPALVFAGHAIGGPGYLLAPLFVFAFVPLLDLLVGADTWNPTPAQSEAMLHDPFFDRLLHAYVPLHLAVIGFGAWVCATGQASGLEMALLTLSVGVVTGGIGITVAHELGHRRAPLDRRLSRLLLACVCYLHFHVEHNRGHHARVATPDDPATARYGESVYRFIPRTVLHSFVHAWQLEASRLKAAGRSPWSPGNLALVSAVLPPVFVTLLALTLGLAASVFFLAQSVVAVLLLEVVNYIEHYGLQRRVLENGRRERVTPLHSWNASQRITNWFLFNLQRHSDHHADAGRHYPVLRHHDESPQLPTGYAGMILLALVPPLWRRVMDPRARAAARRLETA